jgi:hypothetical protein
VLVAVIVTAALVIVEVDDDGAAPVAGLAVVCPPLPCASALPAKEHKTREARIAANTNLFFIMIVPSDVRSRSL